MNATLSVIVPVYNCEKYLHKCIDSILEQTFRDFELILVDDGSTDSSGKICDEYAALDTRIRVIHKENGGLTSARAAGAEAASCDLITFVDSDDWIDPGMYESLLSKLSESGAEMITSGFIRDEDGDRYTDYADEGLYEGAAKDKLCDNIIYEPTANCENILLTACAKIYSRELLLEAIHSVPYDVRSAEDLTYVYPPFIKCERFYITHNTYYHYRINPDSMSNEHKAGEYERLAYTFSVCGRIYERFGEPVLRSLDLLICTYYYYYLRRMVEQCPQRAQALAQMAEICTDPRFIDPVSHVADNINNSEERNILITMLAGKASSVYTMIRRNLAIHKIRLWAGRVVRGLIGQAGIERIRALFKSQKG